jgi:ATP-dependent DNA ligase
MDFRAQWAKAEKPQTVAAAVTKCERPVLEPKYDGWRCVVLVTETGVQIYNPSRNSDPSKCYTGQLPELEAEFAKLPVGTILDGELVALTVDDDGRWVNDFFRIHKVMRGKAIPQLVTLRKGISFIAFDCPMPTIAPKSLPERREYIQSLIESCKPANVSLTLQREATEAEYDSWVALGFEGVVIKDEVKPYGFAKRGHGWFKIKNTTTIDCVVKSLDIDGKGQHLNKVGRMFLGQMVDGELIFRCKTNVPDNAQRDEMTLFPERYLGRVAEIKVYGWHEDGTPRHPTFLRWRSDKEPTECVWSDV